MMLVVTSAKVTCQGRVIALLTPSEEIADDAHAPLVKLAYKLGLERDGYEPQPFVRTARMLAEMVRGEVEFVESVEDDDDFVVQ